jgi:hypothetical protein
MVAQDPTRERERARQLVGLAHRNLHRLECSVTRSEDYLRAVASPPCGAAARWSLGAIVVAPLREVAEELENVRVALPDHPCHVRADGAALRAFVRQLVRTCRCHVVDAPLDLDVVPRPATDGGAVLRLEIRATAPTASSAAQREHLPVRTVLGPAAADDVAAQLRLELARLLRFTVPQALVDRVGAVVQLGGEDRDALLLSAEVPVATADREAADAGEPAPAGTGAGNV